MINNPKTRLPDIDKDTTDTGLIETMKKLDKDMRNASHILGRKEVRYLTDAYYRMQNNRIACGNQARVLGDRGDPNVLIEWNYQQFYLHEKNLEKALNEFVKTYKVGNWLLSIYGIGPIISAGLLSHFDVTRAPTCCHFWRFAGLDPTSHWDSRADIELMAKRLLNYESMPKALTKNQVAVLCKEEGRDLTLFLKNNFSEDEQYDESFPTKTIISSLAKRPWNADLKSLLAFKAGESFVHQQRFENDFYGKLFAARKEQEVAKNASGQFAEQARQVLDNKNIGKDTDAYVWYSGSLPSGVLDGWYSLTTDQKASRLKKMRQDAGTGTRMLPPAHIHARARRYAVKMFVSHLHKVMFEDFYDVEAPKPYVFQNPSLGAHGHFIEPPNYKRPLDFPGKSLKDMQE